MAIRPATASDALEIACFYEDIRRDTVPVVHSVSEIADWLVSHRISQGSSYIWIDRDEILGWVDVSGDDLDQLYVRRGRTGQGIGRQLLEFAKAASPGRLVLYTFQVNEGARRFYRREGFVETAFGDGSMNEEGAPDVKMEWVRA